LPLDPFLHVFGVVEAIGGQYPPAALVGFEPIEVGSAAHAVFEVFIAETAGEVDLAVDAVLFSLL
jgi:hypothetical protein